MAIRRHIEDIIQICFVLFLISMLATFGMTNIFGLIDAEIVKIENKSLQKFTITIVLFIQLVVTSIIYLLIDKYLHKIKNIRSIMGSTKLRDSMSLGQSSTAEYCIHIVLILFLIKINSSLAFEMSYVSKYLNIVNSPYSSH